MRTIGLLGGMGSYATCAIFQRLLDAFPAEKEWDRPRILIDNNCTMPSRVRAILYGENEEQLIREMSDSVEHLAAAGADRILLGCMTAHYFRHRLPHQDKVMDVLAETRREIAGHYSPGAEIACLCTEGSVQTGIWGKALSGYTVRYPDTEGMVRLREFIEAVKQNRVTGETRRAFSQFVKAQPGQCVLLGCTELPLLVENDGLERELVDPIACVIQYLKKDCGT